jgi:hypothetical protein
MTRLGFLFFVFALTVPALAQEPGPYAIEVEKVPDELSGRVTAVDFAPDGRWLLLSHGGEVLARAENGGAVSWDTVSAAGLEGGSGLIAGWWPKSLVVVHGAGISQLFDTDADGKVDFVKALSPVWKFGTSGVLFYGVPGVHDSGDLLMPPRVLTGPWAGSILRLPAEGAPTPWVTGLAKAVPPVSGPDAAWLVAGMVGPAGKESAMIAVVASSIPDSLPEPEPEPANGEPVPATPAKVNGLDENKPLRLADESVKTESKPEEKKDAPKDAETVKAKAKATPPAVVAPTGPIVPVTALRIPAELLSTSPAAIAFPPYSETKTADFGPFSGQGFLAGEASNRLLRFWLEEIDGVWQGGITDFASIDSQTPGFSFLRYTPEGGKLLAGQNGHLFGIRPAGGGLFAVKSVLLASDGGFEVTFTAPVNRAAAIDPAKWKISAGDAPLPLDPATTRLIVSADGLTVSVQGKGWSAGQIYRFDFSEWVSETGAKVTHGPVWYTLNRMPPPLAPAPAPPAEEPAPEKKPEAPAPPAGEPKSEGKDEAKGAAK